MIICTYCKAELKDNEVFASNAQGWKPICTECVKKQRYQEK